MPTGPLHGRYQSWQPEVLDNVCRCTIGRDHDLNGLSFDEYLDQNDEDDDEDEDAHGEALSLEDAALAWGSSGGDEDYTFGYSEDDLRSELES